MMTATDRLFPDGIGEVLHALLNPEPQPGLPYTHTFNMPPTEYDDDGEPLPLIVEPTMTIVRRVQAEALARAYDTVGQVLLYGAELNPLLLDHGVDRALQEKSPHDGR
jgi:hypothetical protein